MAAAPPGIRAHGTKPSTCTGRPLFTRWFGAAAERRSTAHNAAFKHLAPGPFQLHRTA